MKNIYLSLDEARSKLKKRWSDEILKRKVRDMLGDKFIPYFGEKPLAISFRQLVSADNGLAFFYQCSNYIGARPTIMEYLDDMFVSFNEEKKGLGRLRFTTSDGREATVDIMNFHTQEKKMLKELVTHTGESLVEFHHKLIELEGCNIDIRDTSLWFKSIGPASDYYYYKLLHYIAHGVLFDYFYDEGGTNEDVFTDKIIYAAIERIESEFGITPMIVRSYPKHQTDEEDFYWWNHSRVVNDYIVKYSNEHNLF